MGVLQNIRDFFRNSPAEKEQIDTTFSGGMYFPLEYDPVTAKTFEFLENCGDGYEILKGKQQARLSEMMYEVFPFVKRAINDMAGMVGNFELQSIKQGDVSPEVLKELEELAGQMPILSEQDSEEPREFGIDNLIYRMSLGVLKYGLFVTEDRYSDELEYLGCLPFYSMNFGYEYYDKKYHLRYRNLQEVQRGPFMDWIGYDWRTNDPFPHPLLSGGRFFTKLILSVFVAIQNISIRKGAPVQAFLTGIDNDDVLKNPKTLELYKENTTDLRKGIERAVEYQAKGIQSPIVASIPASTKFISQTFGAELVAEIGHETLDRVLSQTVQLLGIPPEMAGIVLGSAGFSPERFRIQYKIWSGKIDNIRTIIEPILWKRLLNFYRSQNINPVILERVSLSFREVDMADAKEKEEIAALRAQTQERQAKVMEQLSMSAGFDAAMEYALREGLIQED